MKEFFFTTPTADEANRDLIMEEFVELADTAMANLKIAEQDATVASHMCFNKSPRTCLVL